MNKRIKKTLITTLSISLLSPLINSGVAVMAQEDSDTFYENQEAEKTRQLTEHISVSYTSENEIILRGSTQGTQKIELRLLDDITYLDEDFKLIIPRITEILEINVKDENGVVIETTSFVPADFVSELGIEMDTEEILDNTVSIIEEQDDISRFSDVKELLNGEDQASNNNYMTTSSIQMFSANADRQHEDGIYYVKQGNNDSFTTIAKSFNISLMQLKVWNPQVSNINIIKVGEPLAVTPQGFEAMLSDEQKSRMHNGDNPSQFKDVYDFINQLAPKAQVISNQQAEEPLYPSLMLAQAIHESGVARAQGESQLARAPYHNLSGIKARGNVPSVLMWTWESYSDDFKEMENSDRINVRIMDYFQKFSSYDESLQRYANLLRFGRGTGEDFYYRGTWDSNTRDVWEVLANGGLRGYATDPAYFSAIRRTITRYNLTRFDEDNRLKGDNRFDTSVAISQKGWQTSNEVVIANGFEFADALAGSPLATLKDAPILLTRQNRVDQNILNEIRRLRPSKITILGGESAISKNVESTLSDLYKGTNITQNITVERLGGDNRYQTASLIADQVKAERVRKGLGAPSQGILVSGQEFADAMSVAPYASEKGLPIYLTRSNSLSAASENGVKDISNWSIIGGPDAVSSNVTDRLSELNRNVTRIYGSDRFETNREVIKQFSPQTNRSNAVYVATGMEFADALTGSVLAAKENNGIILARSTKREINNQVAFAQNMNMRYATLIGGDNSLSPHVKHAFDVLGK